MEYAVVAEAALIALGIVGLLWQDHAHAKDRLGLIEAQAQERERWADERRELLNRLQHPERMPVKSVGSTRVSSNVSPETRRALAQVGTVAPQVANDG